MQVTLGFDSSNIIWIDCISVSPQALKRERALEEALVNTRQTPTSLLSPSTICRRSSCSLSLTSREHRMANTPSPSAMNCWVGS